MKRTSKLHRVTCITAFVGASALLSLSAAHAGGAGGCVYGYGAEQMASETTEQSPIMADQAQDPKWLALQKRLQLEAQSAEDTIVVPN